MEEIDKLREDLLSTEQTKGAALVGYKPSDAYPTDTVGNTLNSLEKQNQVNSVKADQAVVVANDAISKATTAEQNTGNALQKGNNLNDVANKTTALSNIGGLPLIDVSTDSSPNKIPRARSDGKIDINWVRDLQYNLSYIQKALDEIRYPDGIIPFIDVDFTAGALHPSVTFSRAGETTYYDSTGTLRTAGINEPAFDHDPETLKPRGIQRFAEYQNILTKSNEINLWVYNQCNITPDDAVSPTGQKNAYKVVGNTTQNVEHFMQQTVPKVGSNFYVSSVFVKPAGTTRFAIVIVHIGQGTATSNATFGVSASGEVTLTSQAQQIRNVKIQKLQGGWWRIFCEYELIDENNVSVHAFRIYPSTGQSSAQVSNGIDGIYFYGAQVTPGRGIELPYIPTTNSQVTRARESILIGRLTFNYEFSVSYRGEISLDSRANTPFFDIQFQDMSQARPFRGSAGTRILLNNRGGTGDIPVDAQATWPATNVSLSIEKDGITMAANGILGGRSNRPGTVENPIISMGRSDISSGWITSFQMFDKPLADEKLIDLTEIS